MMCLFIFPLLSHLLKQGSRHGERLRNQSIMRDNDRYTRMCLQIIRLRVHGKLFNILHNTIHVLFQCIQSVLKVLIMVLLFRGLVVALARHEEIVGGTLIILLQDFIEEDVPNLVCRREKMMTICEYDSSSSPTNTNYLSI